jgi:hypothetical protein
MRDVACFGVSALIGGTETKGLKLHLEAILGKRSIDPLQKTAL